MTRRTLRILIAKPGLDGHDRGAKVVARALSNAGMEVIYLGLHQTPEMIVNTAADEDVAAIGLSILSGAHNTIFPRVVRLMQTKGMDDVLLFGGGTIPEKDHAFLKQSGVDCIFMPGTDTDEIVDYLQAALRDLNQPNLREAGSRLEPKESSP